MSSRRGARRRRESASKGGHDAGGIQVISSGQAKNFRWYDESWLTSSFNLTYRPDDLQLSRVLLMKKSGGLEMQAHLVKDAVNLKFFSRGLLIEEFSLLGKAPLGGELTGEVEFDRSAKNKSFTGKGAFGVSRTVFRGQTLPDSRLRLSSEGDNMEFMGSVLGERLKGRFTRNGKNSELMLYFDAFDFMPLVALWLGRDIPNLTDLTATGDLSLKGNFAEWDTIRGSGAIGKINFGLKGTPMTNHEPISVKVDNGAVVVNHFQLVGLDSQVTGEYAYTPGSAVKGTLDGKLDLQFLQPFIPGLDFGTGKVTVGLRLSGPPKRYELLGNISVEDGTFRLTGLSDEFRQVQAQVSVSHDKFTVDLFEATVNGGKVKVDGDVKTNRFTALIPNLAITATKVELKFKDFLSTRFSGDFTIKGSETPYLLAGRCRIIEGLLSKFDTGGAPTTRTDAQPTLRFDIACDGKEKLMVKTDVMESEFHGNLHILGDTDQVGLVGSVDSVRGAVLFRETKFDVTSANVHFDSPKKVEPNFNVTARAYVNEQKSIPPQTYEVNLQVSGTPADYRIHLTSTPALAESDIISLLLLGVTSRTQDGNYADLGMTLAGQIPLQSKIQNELGFDVKLGTKTFTGTNAPVQATPQGVTNTTDQTVPNVQIQKDITKRTKVSLSNTIEQVPVKELKIEQMLDDNLTINATAGDSPHTSTTVTQPTGQSYGLDLRYRFQFE